MILNNLCLAGKVISSAGYLDFRDMEFIIVAHLTKVTNFYHHAIGLTLDNTYLFFMEG